MRLLTLTAAGLLLAAPLLRADDRRTPPDADAQAKAEAQIKDLFKDDFTKRKPADLQALASKLIQAAADTKGDLAGQFVLLRLAAEVAAKAGDAADALQAIDAQAKDFAVSAVALKAQALEGVVKATGGAQIDYQAVLDAAMPAADEAQADDDFDAEGHLLHASQVAATKLGNKQLATVAQERGKLVEAMQTEFDNIKGDLETLKNKPDDPDATLHVGRFWCFFKGDWDRGLPLLAVCSDPKLRGLAKKDLNEPAAAADQAALADAWMDVADGEAGTRISQIQLHAYSWYKQSAPQLAGLDKAKVDKKIKDLDKLAEKLTVQKDAPGEVGWFVLFRSFDPQIWDSDKNLGKNNFAVPLSKAPDGVQFLKLTLLATRAYVIIPATNDALKKKNDAVAFGWQGEASELQHGYHLGIYATPIHRVQTGEIAVANFGENRDATGWGFGHRAYKNDMQGYSWEGVPIGPTVFEISVKAGPLTDVEAKHLLGKKEK